MKKQNAKPVLKLFSIDDTRLGTLVRGGVTLSAVLTMVPKVISGGTE